jgi:hypothetical protein
MDELDPTKIVRQGEDDSTKNRWRIDFVDGCIRLGGSGRFANESPCGMDVIRE